MAGESGPLDCSGRQGHWAWLEAGGSAAGLCVPARGSPRASSPIADLTGPGPAVFVGSAGDSGLYGNPASTSKTAHSQ